MLIDNKPMLVTGVKSAAPLVALSPSQVQQVQTVAQAAATGTSMTGKDKINFHPSFLLICILDVPIPINIGITFSTTTPRGRHVSKKAQRKNLPLY